MTRANTTTVGTGGTFPLVGAQLSTAGGFGMVPGRALAVGAEAVQVFSSNARQWHKAPPEPEQLLILGASLREVGIPLFFHSIYLINLGSPDETLRERSTDALTHALVSASLAGAAGVVTHIGSHRGGGFEHAAGLVTDAALAALAAAAQVLAASSAASAPGDALLQLSPLLLENGAGSGDTIGGDLEELALLLAALPLTAGLCLDTAHLFAAGQAVHQAKGLESLLATLQRLALLERVRLVHLNDSGTPFASKRDRHENPGAGYIGLAGLARVVRHPALARVPFILEVPGHDKHGPGAKEISTVKALRGPDARGATLGAQRPLSGTRETAEREAPTPQKGPAPGASCPEASE